MSQTCMQRTFDRHGRPVKRRLPHDVPSRTLDPNNGYARCASCGVEVYVGSGLHPNLGVPFEDAEAEAKARRGYR